jgi:hypothetical protein
LVGFYRGLLTNHGTPPALQPVRSNPVRPQKRVQGSELIPDALPSNHQLHYISKKSYLNKLLHHSPHNNGPKGSSLDLKKHIKRFRPWDSES